MGGGIFRTNVATIGKANIYSSYLSEESQTSTSIVVKNNDFSSLLDIYSKDGRIIVKTKVEKISMTLVSMTGQVLWSNKYNPERTNYYLNGIPAGCYVLSVKAANTLDQNIKVIVNKTMPYEIIITQD